MTRRRTTILTAVAAVAATVAVVLPAAPSSASPEPANDSYGLLASGTYTVSPLDNDEVSPLSLGELTLCGVRSFNRQAVYVERQDDDLVIEVNDRFSGRTQVVYDACQNGERASATITLTIGRLGDVTATKRRGLKGKVVFANPNRVPVKVYFGSTSSGRPDGVKTVPGRGKAYLTTRRTSLYWVGTYRHEGAVIDLGDGVLRNLQRK